MADWITHHGRGYPFPKYGADGEPIPAPVVLVRIRALDRATVEEKANWIEADEWKRWTHDGGAGDILEFQRKD